MKCLLFSITYCTRLVWRWQLALLLQPIVAQDHTAQLPESGLSSYFQTTLAGHQFKYSHACRSSMVWEGAYLEERRGDLLSSALAMLGSLGTDNCCFSIIMTVVHTLTACNGHMELAMLADWGWQIWGRLLCIPGYLVGCYRLIAYHGCLISDRQ